MGERVRIGVIGVGMIGKSHLKRYQEFPDDVEIVAVADLNEAEAKKVAEQFKAPNVYGDFRQLLKRDDIQAVDVCLHNNLHAPVTIAGLEAGKHVYCEKPMAGSYADAKAMYEASRRTGKMLQIQMNTLYAPEHKVARRLIKDGALGKLYYARSFGFRRRGRPWVDGYGTPAFVNKEIAAGGALFDMGIYHMAQVMDLLGNPDVLTVTGSTHQELDMYPRPRQVGELQRRRTGPRLHPAPGRDHARHRGILGDPLRRLGVQQDPRQQGRTQAGQAPDLLLGRRRRGVQGRGRAGPGGLPLAELRREVQVLRQQRAPLDRGAPGQGRTPSHRRRGPERRPHQRRDLPVPGQARRTEREGDRRRLEV
ncbi:MAG: Gfo/Idh/MocA family oxidoreductase [Planctomycetota bacterium]|nr:Gfo/Idh/MocA family oxidoreductase [Planctomycetota bacterium]